MPKPISEAPGPRIAARTLLAALCLSAGFGTPVPAQQDGFAARAAVLGPANAAAGPRTVPGRSVPVPGTVSPAAQAQIAAPYSPFWNLAPASDEEWRAVIREAAEATLPMLAEARASMGVTMERTEMGGVPVFVLRPETVPDAHAGQTLINLHGGGYVFSPGESGTGEAMMMATYGGYEVIAVDYRMPPDAPFPAALDDALAVYKAVIETVDPTHVAVFGTSAGGGLTLALMHRLRQEGLPMPAAIAPLTPWADLTDTGDSYRANEWLDNVLVSYDGYLGRAAQLYANGHDMADPLLSPINGSFEGFPPAILVAGTRDLFLSNTVRTHRALRRAGIVAELQVYEGLSHAQYLFDMTMPETREIHEEITGFFDAHLQK